MNRLLNKKIFSFLFLFFIFFSQNTICRRINKIYENLDVLDNLFTNVLIIEGNLNINGVMLLNGTLNSGSMVGTQGSATQNAVARFADNSGNLLKSSGVKIDSSGNIELNGITKNGITVSWPSIDGAPFAYLTSDGAGSLYYGNVSGTGNVSASSLFLNNNRLLVTDILTSATSIKQSGVTLVGSNITGVNTLSAVNIYADLIGNASSADQAPNFSGTLSGDVSGGQTTTSIDFIGSKPASLIAQDTSIANSATSLNVASTVLMRNALGDFYAGDIQANLTGDATGILSGTASTANTASFTKRFTEQIFGDVIGTQTSTVVVQIGSKSADSISSSVDEINNATSLNVASTIVKRDGLGGIDANNVMADIVGTATANLYGQAGSTYLADRSSDFTGVLLGDVIGNQSSTQIIEVGDQTAAYIAAGVSIINTATNANILGSVVARDSLGSFSATRITADLVGSVTGRLYGNASTADFVYSAINTLVAQDFTGVLLGQVTGTQGATVVNNVGTKTAAQIVSAADMVFSATSENIYSTIATRDNLGDFTISKVTVAGTTSAPLDAASKAYVDEAVSSGLVIKDQARVVSLTTTTTYGLSVIDGITLLDGDRVLLVGQDTPSSEIYNGLWIARTSDWERPLDFDNGQSAQRSYVTIESGNTQDGSSWLCSTPEAIIGIDNIEFAQFSISDQTTAANVGVGQGGIFANKTGNIINLKSIENGSHITVTNNADTISISTDATSAGVPNTIASRDINSNVTGTLIGSASLNLLKSGAPDAMTGNLIMTSGLPVNMKDSTGLNAMGIKAPSSLVSSYTIDLPSVAPIAGQLLQASSSSTTAWVNVSLPSIDGKVYYVTLSGSDSNDGSIYFPYRTLKYAVEQANLVASIINPVAIIVGPGIFEEDNIEGPIIIDQDGISIIGSSITGTIIKPISPDNDLLRSIVSSVLLANLTLDAAEGSTANGFVLDSAYEGNVQLDTVATNSFFVGLNLNNSGAVENLNVVLQNVRLENNNTAIIADGLNLNMKHSILKGSSSGVALNTAISLVGIEHSCLAQIYDTNFAFFDTAISCGTNSTLYFCGSTIETSKNGLDFYDGAKGTILGSNFLLNEDPNSVNINTRDAGTVVYLNGCFLDCANSSMVATGTAVKVTNDAQVYFSNSAIERASTAIICGTDTDTSNTKFIANYLSLIYCPTDIDQRGFSTVQFVGGTVETPAINIQNPDNVIFSAFNSDNETTLAFGNKSDLPQNLYKVYNGQTNQPFLSFESNLYGAKGMLFQNLNDNSAFNGIYSKFGNASYIACTGDRTKNAKISLISEPEALGQGAIVGWEIAKDFAGDLLITYTDHGYWTKVIKLNGQENNVEFPDQDLKLVWDATTNLYRDSAGILKSDGTIIVNDLSANYAVIADANKKLASSSISTATLGYLSGVTSSVQSQLDSRLSKSGGTMTGNLILPAGSYLSPSLEFSAGSSTGLSTQSTNTLVISTAGLERMKITDDGSIYINKFTTPGVLHNNNVGKITSSLITNYDIDEYAAIQDTKLATISTPGKVLDLATTATAINVAEAIVQRDMLGSFTATTIYSDLFGNASSATYFSGTFNGDMIGSQTSTIVNSIGGGLVSTIDISNATDVINSATSNNVANAVVKRDDLGNFAATAITIIAATTNPTDCATKGYVDAQVQNYVDNQTDFLYRFNVISDGTNNITTEGLYTFTCNVLGNIVITADNVTIDMYGFTLNSTTNPAIQIGTGDVGRENIEIKNGKIVDLIGYVNDAILVGANCSSLAFSNLETCTCLNGINFNGAAGSINRGKVENCSFVSCNKGVNLNNSNKILFRNCEAINCVQTGFDQQYCNYNYFDRCNAIGTKNSSATVDAIGFSTVSGRGSLFNSCIANETTKLYGQDYTDGLRMAAGYYIGGIEGYMERDTKIINSIANNSYVGTSTCKAYGIFLEPVLKSGSMESLLITLTGPYLNIPHEVKWSPDGKYLTWCGYDNSSGLRVFKFTDGGIYQVASAAIVDNEVTGAEWSPDGKYIAIVKFTGSDPRLLVYSFDGSFLYLSASYTHGANLRSVSWSPDGKYLAIGGEDGGSGYKLRVLKFNPSIPSLSLIASIDTGGTRVMRVNWSPCGRYIATSLNNLSSAPIKIYEFNGSSTLNLVASSAVSASADMYVASWSPDGKYLVVGGFETINCYAYILKFDASNADFASRLLYVTKYIYGGRALGNYLFSADWSPNGKYIVLAGDNNDIYSASTIQVVYFDGVSLTQVSSKNYTCGTLRGASISKDGKYLALGVRTTPAKTVNVYSFMDVPTNCLIDSNQICDCTSYLATGTGFSRQAIGICGSGETLYLRNDEYKNDVNSNKAVYNVYGTSLLTADPKEYDNIWQTPYYNGYGMN